MILATVIVVIVAGLGAAFLTVSYWQSRATLSASLSDASYHAAEAGLDDAIQKMNAFASATWAGNDEDTKDTFTLPSESGAEGTSGTLRPDIQGSLDYSVFNVYFYVRDPATGLVIAENRVSGMVNGWAYRVTVRPAYTGQGEYMMMASGSRGQERRGVTAIVTPNVVGDLGDYGLFAKSSIRITSNWMLVDSYKSSGGAYNPVNSMGGSGNNAVLYDRSRGNIGSNGEVEVTNAYLFGNATPPPSGLTSVGNSAYISGTTLPAQNVIDVPDYVYSLPASVPAAVNFPTAGGRGGTVTISNASSPYHYTSIQGNSKDSIVISGPVTMYVEGNIDFTAFSNMSFATQDSTLTIHQRTGSTKLRGHANLFAGTPRGDQFKLFSGGDSFQITGQSEIRGMIYAPNADWDQTANDTKVFGKVVANNIFIRGNTEFHRDEDMIAGPKPTPVYKIKAYREYVP
jgi:hypothetical protein